MATDEFVWDRSVDWWATQRHVPALGRTLHFYVIPEGESARPTARQVAALAQLDALPADLWEALDDAAEAYRRRTDEEVDLAGEGLGHIQRANVRDHYRIEQGVIPRLGECADVYHFLTGGCDWETEHGLEVLLKNGVVVACGPNDCLYSKGAEWDEYLRPAPPRRSSRRRRPGPG
jgi:hypothetical protein